MKKKYFVALSLIGAMTLSLCAVSYVVKATVKKMKRDFLNDDTFKEELERQEEEDDLWMSAEDAYAD